MSERLQRFYSMLEFYILKLISQAEHNGLLPKSIAHTLGFSKPNCSLKVARSILFICKGNICRSAYADYKLKQELAKKNQTNIKVFSGGVWTKDGKPANAQAIISSKKRGVDLSEHRTHSVTKEDLEAADIIFIMDTSHRKAISKLAKDALPKTFYLARCIEKNTQSHPLIIKDPYGKSEEVFQLCFNIIDKAILEITSSLQKNA